MTTGLSSLPQGGVQAGSVDAGLRLALLMKQGSVLTGTLHVVASWLWLLPRNCGSLLLGLYRWAISPFLGDRCRYYPSCSSYTLQSVQAKGLVMGVLAGGWRLLRCNPWSAGGFDWPAKVSERYSVSRLGFVSSHRRVSFRHVLAAPADMQVKPRQESFGPGVKG